MNFKFEEFDETSHDLQRFYIAMIENGCSPDEASRIAIAIDEAIRKGELDTPLFPVIFG
ncbi:MAG: hypothetical protein M1536_00620 [Firmicutes bacterium]|nr:hypothetical protein [Bacillota bacterium]